MEYHLVLLQQLRENGKTLDDVIDQMKTVLWYVKNERMRQINNELGL
jgi:hypothetical protein